MTTYYVTKAGNDANNGTSLEAAKRTINAGLSLMKGGDTLLIGAGTYDEAISNPDCSGTAAAYTKIHALPGETVWLTPTTGTQGIYFTAHRSYIEFERIHVSTAGIAGAAVRVEVHAGGNPHHIRVKNAEIIGPSSGQTILLNYSSAGTNGGNEFQYLTVHGCGADDFDHGIYIQSSDNLVEHCLFYDFPGAGVHIYNGYGLAPNGNIIRHNIIRDGRKTTAGQRHWGIILYSTQEGTQVYNNLIYNIPSDGKACAGMEIWAHNIQIDHNTITKVAGPGINILQDSTGITLRNNLSYGNSPNITDQGTDTVAVSNLTGTIDPLFVDAGAGNFRLQAGSGARDTGTLVATVTTDLEGVARPQGSGVDVGAYEYTGDAPPPGGGCGCGGGELDEGYQEPIDNTPPPVG